MFARLVDVSVQRIAEITADGRRFDRQEVARLADVWDNNTTNFFGMLGVRGRWRRERAARAGLRWMAGFGGERHDWMTAVGGEPMRRLLRRPAVDRWYYRDYAGRIHASVLPLAAAGLEHDYDLAHARVETVRVERSADGFAGWAQIRAPRAFADGAGEFYLYLPVEQACFDTADVEGLQLEDARVRFGAAGLLCGGPVTVWPRDEQWYLSQAAGRVAATVAPWRKRTGPRTAGVPGPWGSAGAAAWGFHESMLHIRRVRCPGHVGRVALERLVTPLAGAGARALAASRLPGREREREFGRLAESWGAVPDGPRAGDVVPEGACLTLVSCGDVDGAVIVNFAEPVDGRWPVRAARLDRPGRVVVRCEDGVLRLG